jgi:hypothetical protein
MIDVVINHVASSANKYLMRSFDLHEDVVVVSNILEQDGTVATHVDNKIVVSLVNIEKEVFPLTRNFAATSHSRSTNSNEPIHFNLYLMVASYFSGSNYQEGLKFLSKTISYFHSHNMFDHQNSPSLHPSVDKVVLDIENQSIDDLSKLWGMLSGKYLPSVLYKVRMVTYESNAVLGQTSELSNPIPTVSKSDG